MALYRFLFGQTGSDNIVTGGSAEAVLNTDTSTADMQFVIDEDSMATNSATKVPTQQSVKAYVDTAIAGAGGGDVTLISSGTSTAGKLDLSLSSSYSAIRIFIYDYNSGGTGRFLDIGVSADAGSTFAAMNGRTLELGASYAANTPGVATDETAQVYAAAYNIGTTHLAASEIVVTSHGVASTPTSVITNTIIYNSNTSAPTNFQTHWITTSDVVANLITIRAYDGTSGQYTGSFKYHAYGYAAS